VSGGPAASLVCCGLIGTTVDDKGTLERAYAEACATQGIVPGTAAYAHFMVTVHQSRGEPPVEVFRGLFPGRDGRAEAAAMSFERSFRAAVDRMGLEPAPGAADAVSELREAGLRVCVITGLPRRLLGIVLDTLDWWRNVDLALCHDDVPRGFPWPDPLLTAMLRLGVEDVREAAFAGGTVSGVKCGRRAGASIVAGVLTGGHTKDRLHAAGATHLIEGLADLPPLLVASGAESAKSPPAGNAPSPRVPLERRSAGL
jgi:phosphonatase-like hydrolase